ncbi:MAG: hypothetical protein QM805_29435 [Pseudomonas sp.]
MHFDLPEPLDAGALRARFAPLAEESASTGACTTPRRRARLLVMA